MAFSLKLRHTPKDEIDRKGNYSLGDTVHFTFDGKVAHVFSKETSKNLEY